jgi:hypothetical protein
MDDTYPLNRPLAINASGCLVCPVCGHESVELVGLGGFPMQHVDLDNIELQHVDLNHISLEDLDLLLHCEDGHNCTVRLILREGRTFVELIVERPEDWGR